MCKSVDGQYPRAMLPNPQGTLSTFEVGIALLTAVELERERQCGQCILAMPILHYIAACAWFRQRICKIVSIKFSKTDIHENLDPRKFSAIR